MVDAYKNFTPLKLICIMRTAMNDKNDQKSYEPEEEIITAEESEGVDEPDLVEQEENSNAKLKVLRDKLKKCEAERMSHLEELQRAKADFLNAKKRLTEDKENDKRRFAVAHVERLLPLCDSFYMAMADKDAWSEAPEKWRKGIEGIHSQLQSILDSYQVSSVSPVGEDFDPEQHEALSMVPVEDKKQHQKIISVIQQGFVMKGEQREVVVRPARVTIGEFSEANTKTNDDGVTE